MKPEVVTLKKEGNELKLYKMIHHWGVIQYNSQSTESLFNSFPHQRMGVLLVKVTWIKKGYLISTPYEEWMELLEVNHERHYVHTTIKLFEKETCVLL